jgi:hypothetical protein
MFKDQDQMKGMGQVGLGEYGHKKKTCNPLDYKPYCFGYEFIWSEVFSLAILPTSFCPVLLLS